MEPLAHNPFLNLFRCLTPSRRTLPSVKCGVRRTRKNNRKNSGIICYDLPMNSAGPSFFRHGISTSYSWTTSAPTFHLVTDCVFRRMNASGVFSISKSS